MAIFDPPSRKYSTFAQGYGVTGAMQGRPSFSGFGGAGRDEAQGSTSIFGFGVSILEGERAFWASTMKECIPIHD